MINVIGDGRKYINVYNNGDFSIPICANIPIDKKEIVLSVYGNCKNHTIEFTNFKRETSWVIR